MTTLWFSVRAEEGAVLFEQLAEAARAAERRDGAFAIEVAAVENVRGTPVRVVFNNDDMERDEVSGKVLVEWEES